MEQMKPEDLQTAGGINRWVSNRVKEVRKARDRSQQFLGDGMGLCFQQIQKYENGTNRISVGAICVIARLLECPVGMFLPTVDEPCSHLPVLSDAEYRLLEQFRKIPIKQQRAVCDIIEIMSKVETGDTP